MYKEPLDSTSSSNQESTLGFEFRGDGWEYFKIWIVNVLLTIITIGLYSPWAKVRNKRYFYSNLFLNNQSFRYLADPFSIFKSRLIAIGALIVYTFVYFTYPIVGLALGLLLIISIPYFINKSIEFNHRMSAYNNIQFRFKGSYFGAVMVLLVWPLLGLLTLGMLYPLAWLKMNQYIVNNSSYGTSKFNFTATAGDYYKIFFICLGTLIPVGGIAFAIMTFATGYSFIGAVLIGVAYVGTIVYFMVSTANLFYSSLMLDPHSFQSELTIMGMLKVMLINLFFTIITLGLYFPAAQVRMTKYISSCIAMNAHGSLDSFVAAEKENVSALGEEMGEVFDFA